ncbi:unnamed protein product, partial [Trichobilharzia szidati]
MSVGQLKLRIISVVLRSARLRNYVNESVKINEFKFEVDSYAKDQLLSIERKIVQYLRKLFKKKYINGNTQMNIKPIGSQVPNFYGRVEIHKPGAPLRTMLLMINPPYDRTAHWLCELLQPLRKSFGRYIVSDSFQFVKQINNVNVS